MKTLNEVRAILDKPFPPSVIEIRKYDGLDFVQWRHYSNRLNEAFGLDWSVRIIDRWVGDDEAAVSIELTHPVLADSGEKIGSSVKMATGGARLNISNAHGAAQSYALKKAAMILGIGADIVCLEDAAEVKSAGAVNPRKNKQAPATPAKKTAVKKAAKKKAAKKSPGHSREVLETDVIPSTFALEMEAEQRLRRPPADTRVEYDPPTGADDLGDRIASATTTAELRFLGTFLKGVTDDETRADRVKSFNSRMKELKS